MRANVLQNGQQQKPSHTFGSSVTNQGVQSRNVTLSSAFANSSRLRLMAAICAENLQGRDSGAQQTVEAISDGMGFGQNSSCKHA